MAMQLCWENKVNGLLLSCFVRQYKLNIVKIVYGKQFGLVAQSGRRSGSLIAPLFLRSNSLARKRFPSHKISYPGS